MNNRFTSRPTSLRSYNQMLLAGQGYKEYKDRLSKETEWFKEAKKKDT